eukprot:CAMPEP_0174322386 /NCGR_PEP_ID=MMETSP0810-20121108/10962_1 /TAXON_ID=73025 ORGANISM="Eutreptiella gymnastica-like, Strain CCMP1594" /NCGR_SAMPLE_ID=MMETSP0810 /ASSEMBLY_ACC=CAM_ASM_000659 /LENGTH=139 /DNA_ID=CAMNT_0015434175 /DNA_START=639 /DNA_END=1055 /DNA_ORIENTATION=-
MNSQFAGSSQCPCSFFSWRWSSLWGSRRRCQVARAPGPTARRRTTVGLRGSSAPGHHPIPRNHTLPGPVPPEAQASGDRQRRPADRQPPAGHRPPARAARQLLPAAVKQPPCGCGEPDHSLAPTPPHAFSHIGGPGRGG